MVGPRKEDDIKNMLNMQMDGKRRRGVQRKHGWTRSGMTRFVQDDERHGTESKCVSYEDKGRPITTWKRPIGEKGDHQYMPQIDEPGPNAQMQAHSAATVKFARPH